MRTLEECIQSENEIYDAYSIEFYGRKQIEKWQAERKAKGEREYRVEPAEAAKHRLKAVENKVQAHMDGTCDLTDRDQHSRHSVTRCQNCGYESYFGGGGCGYIPDIPFYEPLPHS